MKRTWCALCPKRSFDRVARALRHVKKYHTKKRNYAAAGPKQLKVAQAIFDNDRITGAAEKGNYLARSGKVLKESLTRSFGTATTSVSRREKDKKLVLLLDAHGPRYVLGAKIGTTIHARKHGYVFYTREFATAIFRAALL